jgi:hypothetical protein
MAGRWARNDVGDSDDDGEPNQSQTPVASKSSILIDESRRCLVANLIGRVVTDDVRTSRPIRQRPCDVVPRHTLSPRLLDRTSGEELILSINLAWHRYRCRVARVRTSWFSD